MMSLKVKIIAVILMISVNLALSAPGFFRLLSDTFNDDFRPRVLLIDDATEKIIPFFPDSSELDLSPWWLNMTEKPSNITTTTERPEYPEEIREELERVLGPRKGPKPTSKNFKNWDFNKPYEEARKYITDYDSGVSYFEERDKWIAKKSKNKKKKNIVDVLEGDFMNDFFTEKQTGENTTIKSNVNDNKKKMSNKQQQNKKMKKKNKKIIKNKKAKN